MRTITPHDKKFFIVVLCVLLLAGGVYYVAHSYPRVENSAWKGRHVPMNPPLPPEHMTVAGVPLIVEVARTPDQEQRGLSGRVSLAADHGMLFIFPNQGRPGFWMPDMNFAIDIIWIGADWRVADISPDITPESYPKAFSPFTDIQYVLEVPAGTAKMHHFTEGDKVVFPSEK